MNSLYTEQNLTDLRKQIRKRMLVFFTIFAFAVAVITVLLVQDNHKENRPEMLTTAAVILFGCAMIGFYDLAIHPLRSYAKHIDTSLHGRCHDVSVLFDHEKEESSVVDGVVYRELIFLGDADKHGDRDRTFYWDREIPVPDFHQGQEVSVRYYDRFVTGYQV